MTVANETLAALRGLLPAICGIGCQPLVRPLPPLSPDEQTAVAGAAPPRRQEFALGRAAARSALRAIGIGPVAVPMGAEREPVWPTGVVGSIAHQKEIAVAVAARASGVVALGVDIESTGAVTEDLWSELFRMEEMAFLQAAPASQRRRLATALFSVKEAFYKFQFPHTRQWLGFKDVAVVFRDNCERCIVKVGRPLSLAGQAPTDTFAARAAINDTVTLAAISLLPGHPCPAGVRF